MFSRVDAEQLRQKLPRIEFLPNGSGSCPSLAGAAAELHAAYRKQYGLDFCNNEARREPQTAICNIGTIVSGNYELVCQQFLPLNCKPRKTAFVLHGYFDHAGLYTHLIRHLIEANVAVVVFDLPGHGLSSGEAASINSFREYSNSFLDCLRTATHQGIAEPWVTVGQSTGAAVIMDALLDKNLSRDFSFQHYVLLGPLLKPRHWSRSKILFSLSRRFVAATRRKFSENSHDAAFLKFLQHSDQLQSQKLPRDWVLAMIDYYERFDRTPPLNQKLEIIQGTDDSTVDWEKNIPKILAKFPGSKVYKVENARHHLVNESEEYRTQVFRFLSQILDIEKI